MKSNNISLMPAAKQRAIELQKQAALLSRNLKMGKISRICVKNAIDAISVNDRESFREMVNSFRRMK